MVISAKAVSGCTQPVKTLVKGDTQFSGSGNWAEFTEKEGEQLEGAENCMYFECVDLELPEQIEVWGSDTALGIIR